MQADFFCSDVVSNLPRNYGEIIVWAPLSTDYDVRGLEQTPSEASDVLHAAP